MKFRKFRLISFGKSNINFLFGQNLTSIKNKNIIKISLFTVNSTIFRSKSRFFGSFHKKSSKSITKKRITQIFSLFFLRARIRRRSTPESQGAPNHDPPLPPHITGIASRRPIHEQEVPADNLPALPLCCVSQLRNQSTLRLTRFRSMAFRSLSAAARY